MTLQLVGGKHMMSSPSILKKLFPKKVTEENKISEEQRMKAMIFVLGADPARYSSLHKTLENGILLGQDEYPMSITTSYKTC